ncbi:active breakpoint cluster region-related protein-like [Ambystoma mexicanum]|uniref:active breakpoint cluster region-related protein-like n=1 Tax=Ambystoma mexicanum TaxID=8296 RepID=UPI0037E8642E
MDLFYEAVGYLHENNVNVVESDLEDDEDCEAVFEQCTIGSLTFMDSPLCLLRGSDDSGPTSPNDPIVSCEETLLEKRTSALRKMAECEGEYLSGLEALVLLKKALKMTANTSQPVLSIQQIQAIFFQVPELLQLHQGFYRSLRHRLEQGESQHPVVGDLFQSLVTQLGVYRSYIGNHQLAFQTVKKCSSSDARFKKVAEEIKLPTAAKDAKSTYTLEELLLTPIDRVTRNTLALHDLLKYTPKDHQDYTLLQDALSTCNYFLSGVNEEISPRKSSESTTTSKKRCLVKDGFLTDVSDGNRRLRHLFLFSDLLLCTKLKPGKQEGYKCEWFVPLTDVTLQSPLESEVPLSFPSESLELLDDVRLRIYQAKLELQEEKRLSRGIITRVMEKAKRKLVDNELWLLRNAPNIPLNIHSKNGKMFTVLLSSEYELLEWKEQIDQTRNRNLDSEQLVFSGITKLTSRLVELRRTETLPLQSESNGSNPGSMLCGTLTIALHSIKNLPTSAAYYISLESDTFGYFEKKSESSDFSSETAPDWEEEVQIELDGARALRLLCHERVTEKNVGRGTVIGRTELQLDPRTLQPMEWMEITADLHGVEIVLSLQFVAHDLQPPSTMSGTQKEVFGAPIATTCRRDGSLIPHIILRCAEQVEKRGLEELGIYRISGLATDVQTLRVAFNTDPRVASVRLPGMDVHAIAGTLKLYLRELPEPLLGSELFSDFTQCLDISDPVEKDRRMRVLLNSIPEFNLHTFLFLLEHLKRVACKEAVNKMTLYNLATVFGPTLLRPPQKEPSDAWFPAHISQEVVVQVQVLLHYLQCENLVAPQDRRRTRSVSAVKPPSEVVPVLGDVASDPLEPRR